MESVSNVKNKIPLTNPTALPCCCIEAPQQHGAGSTPVTSLTVPPAPRWRSSRSACPLPAAVAAGSCSGRGAEGMAALGRVSRLLLGAAGPRSPPARSMAAAAHEGGGGNGALRGGRAAARRCPWRALPLRARGGGRSGSAGVEPEETGAPLLRLITGRGRSRWRGTRRDSSLVH